MNKHFVNVATNLAKTFSMSKFSSRNYFRKRISNSIVLKETDPYEIEKILAYMISPILSKTFNL